jgi:hypothetical protein
VVIEERVEGDLKSTPPPGLPSRLLVDSDSATRDLRLGCRAVTAARPATTPSTDKQLVEIAGRNLLVSSLVASGLEVARPERDRGVDLIAYLDLDQDLPFTAVPVQLKASAGTGVSLLRKYEKFSRLLTVIGWHVTSPSTSCFYALGPRDVAALAQWMGWANTNSWSGGLPPGTPHPKGGYYVRAATARLIDALEQYKIRDSDHWRSKMLELVREAG